MKISDRLTDYGLIGAFFWMVELPAWALGFFPHMSWANIRGLWRIFVTVATNPSLAALLGVLALVLIFFTGIVIDTFAAIVFSRAETKAFIGYMQRNESWMLGVMNENRAYIQDDWEQLVAALPYYSARGIFKRLAHRPKRGDRIRPEERSLRIQGLMFSSVFLAPGMDKVELLNTQMSLWNTSRGIAGALILVSLLQLVSLRENHSFGYVAFFFFLVSVAFVAVIVARYTYKRLCSTLFALAYLATK